MKLIRKTINQIGLALLPVMIVGTVFINYTIRWIAYQEADEYLTYEMERMERDFERTGVLPEVQGVSELIEGSLLVTEPVFTDTLLQIYPDIEPERYRELRFVLESDGRPNKGTVILRQVTLSKGEIAKGSVFITMGLLLLMTLTILVVVNIQTERIWSPFFRTLHKLGSYRVQEEAPVFDASDVHEFHMLNQTLNAMLQKMSGDYQRVKEFNENISHELQTHLAVVKTTTEELINEYAGNEVVLDQARRAYVAATKLSHIHKSLLLLSKIGNKEFDDTSLVRPMVIIQQALEEFGELIQLRNIRIDTELQDNRVRMDYGLAVVLITNLIKNAVKHNLDGGLIRVSYTGTMLEVVNTGRLYTGDPRNLLQRFIRGDDGNTGLGLAIARQICETYHFTLNYLVQENLHMVRIDFGVDSTENLQI